MYSNFKSRKKYIFALFAFSVIAIEALAIESDDFRVVCKPVNILKDLGFKLPSQIKIPKNLKKLKVQDIVFNDRDWRYDSAQKTMKRYENGSQYTLLKTGKLVEINKAKNKTQNFNCDKNSIQLNSIISSSKNTDEKVVIAKSDSLSEANNNICQRTRSKDIKVLFPKLRTLKKCNPEDEIWNNCFAKYEHENGDVETGQWQNNRLNGQGQRYNTKLNYFYEGEFKAARFDGIGFLRQENNDSYYGQFSNGLRDGVGKGCLAGENYVFDAKFENDKQIPDNQKLADWAEKNPWFFENIEMEKTTREIDKTILSLGFDPNTDEFYEELDRRLRLVYPNFFNQQYKKSLVATKSPSKIFGELQKTSSLNICPKDIQFNEQEFRLYRNGKPVTCLINYKFDDNLGLDIERFIGEVVDGFANGNGYLSFSSKSDYSGDYYFGNFLNNNFQGTGEYYYHSTGETYIGEFVNGEMGQYGAWYYANGDKYIGQFEDGRFNGWGTYEFANGDKYIGEHKNSLSNGNGTYYFVDGARYEGGMKDSKFHGNGKFFHIDGNITTGIWDENKFTNVEVASGETTSTSPSNNIQSSQEEVIAKLQEEIAALRAQETSAKTNYQTDSEIPVIEADYLVDKNLQTVVFGKVTDDVKVAEIAIDGVPIEFNSDGSFEKNVYIPRGGKSLEIIAFDINGNRATKTVDLVRRAIKQAKGPSFTSLNPSLGIVSKNPDALALIIGVSDYERTPAKAAYADKDAQMFYDYAMLKLGIPSSNIKELVNTDADEVDVRLAVKDWIARTTKQGRSDVYVFFAGHGLASEDGKNMYLLPHDGEPRLLADTAIQRNELFADIAAANPRSVTVFLDTCYSGTTRGTDMLIAARPIAIRAKQQNIPDGFTVFTAAGGDQTAKPLEEAKHGMFSYFLMKGMEGDADSNQDNQITAAELHEYVAQNVVQQSGGSQVPELQGDTERVLVRFQ